MTICRAQRVVRRQSFRAPRRDRAREIEIDITNAHRILGMPRREALGDVRADEAGATGEKDAHATRARRVARARSRARRASRGARSPHYAANRARMLPAALDAAPSRSAATTTTTTTDNVLAESSVYNILNI